MASAKDTFESVTFGAMSFACGTWRGVGADVAYTLVGQWSNVIQCHSRNQRIEAKSANKRIDAYAANKRLET